MNMDMQNATEYMERYKRRVFAEAVGA